MCELSGRSVDVIVALMGNERVGIAVELVGILAGLGVSIFLIAMVGASGGGYIPIFVLLAGPIGGLLFASKIYKKASGEDN